MIKLIQTYCFFVFYHVGDGVNGDVIHQYNDPHPFTPSPCGANLEDHPLTIDGIRSQ
jgi:hypothetical protein